MPSGESVWLSAHPMNTASVSGNRIVHRARACAPDGFLKVEYACGHAALSGGSPPASQLRGSAHPDPPFSGEGGLDGPRYSLFRNTVV
jgi:hypothetical protein